MHEYSIIASLLDRVEAEVEARGAPGARRLHVDLGELAGVEPHLLTLAFAAFKQGTACEGAVLTIHRVAARWACRDCDRRVVPGPRSRCPGCGAPARLIGGDEILLTGIEMEDD